MLGLVELALIIALGLALGEIAWKLVPPAPGLPAVSAITRTTPPADMHISGSTRVANNVVDTNAIKALFGRAEAVEQTGPLFVPERETPIDLTLKGVLAYRISGTKLALIAQGNQAETLYALGERVSGAEIIQIDSRRVLLRRNGVTESLTLKVETLQTVADDDAREGIRAVGGHERVVKREAFERELGNLSQLVQQAHTEPYTENGRPVGIRLVRIEDGSLFYELGLRAEDVIRSVNGAPVRNTEDALKAYEAVRFSNSYAIDVTREGRELTLNYSIQ